MSLTYESTFAEYAEAFAIFAKYSNESFVLEAEHDEIFALCDVGEESDEDRLMALGWTHDGNSWQKFT